MAYLSYIEQPQPGKTKVFEVINVKHNICIGWIKWYGPFRKYCYITKYDDTVFDSNCLKEIAGFLDNLMHERKNG